MKHFTLSFLLCLLALTGFSQQGTSVRATNGTAQNLTLTGTPVDNSVAAWLPQSSVIGGVGTIINNTNTFYVRPNGNNGTAAQGRPDLPWADPQSALTAIRTAVSGGNTNRLAMYMQAGVYNIGNTSLWPTNNMTIMGDGTNATILISTADEHAQGPAIMAWDGLTVMNMTIVQRQVDGAPSPPNAALKDQTAFGALSDSPNAAFGGTATLWNVCLVAGAHGVQLNSSGTRPRVNMLNTTCYTSNAPVQVLTNAGMIYANTFEWYNFGPEPRGRLFSCGIQNTGGLMELHNGIVHVQGFSAATQVFGLVSGGLTGSPMETIATNLIDNVVFDVQANGSSGTIADIFTQPEANSDTNRFKGLARYDGTALVISTNSSAPYVPSANIDGLEIRTGTVGTARLGSGSASSSTFLRGDSTWASPTVSVVDPQSLTGVGTIPTNAFKYLPVVLTALNVVSNTTSETSLLPTNALTGGFGGSLVIPPSFWVTGAQIFVHMEGYTTCTSGTYEWRLRLVPTNTAITSGIVIGDTTAISVGTGTTTPWEYIVWMTYLGGNTVQVAGYVVKPNLAAHNFAALNNQFTITNSQTYGLYPTLTYNTAATNNFAVTVGGGLFPVGP